MDQELVTENDTIILHIWPGEWNLPSLDPDCLIALCYLKFTDLEHEVVMVDSSLKLFRRKLFIVCKNFDNYEKSFKAKFLLYLDEYPRLVCNNVHYIGLEKVLAFLKSKRNLDLDDQNYADMLAQLNLFKEKFIPAFNMLCWMEEDNTYTVIRRAYGKYLQFPLSLIKLKQMTNSAQNSIICNYRATHVKLETLKPQLLNDAKECLSNVSNILFNNVFTFENRPSLIDAYLFGYLSILSKASFIGSPLKNQLSICSNLSSLTNRILKDFFHKEIEEIERLKQIEKEKIKNSYWYTFVNLFGSNSSEKTTLDQNEEWETNKQRLLALVVGITAMVSYALAVGIIKINFTKTDLEFVEKSIELD